MTRTVRRAVVVGMCLSVLVALLPDPSFTGRRLGIPLAVLGHAVLEWTGIMLALSGAILAMLHRRLADRDPYVLLLATVLGVAAATDLFHLLTSIELVTVGAESRQSLALTWITGRTLVASVAFLGALYLPARDTSKAWAAWAFVGLSAIGVVGAVAWIASGGTVPEVLHTNTRIARPYEFLPMVLYACTATLLLLTQRGAVSVGRPILLLCVLPDMLAQQLALSSPAEPYGALFFGAHFAKLTTYATAMLGVLCVFVEAVREQRIVRGELEHRRVKIHDRNIALELAQLRAFQNRREIDRVTLEAKLAARLKSEFVATVSHEIRTPMNGVLGSTELFDTQNLTKPQKQLMQTIRSSGNMLLAIVNDILDFEKIETGAVDFERVPVNVRAMVEEVVGMARPGAAQRQTSINTEIDENVPPFVSGDPSRLRQVLLNLTSNAAKFTEEGTVSVRVRRVDELGGRRCRLAFEVEDTGIGIKDPSVLFAPFRQEDGSIGRRFGGTGLGLAICQRLVSAMGGIIAVESLPGHGSLFWFELVFDVAEAPVSLMPRRPSLVPREPVKVLLVEDNPVNQMLAKRMLEKVGCVVTVASNGQEAVDCVAIDAYEMIFMDCQMPVMDGFVATRTIRAMSSKQAEVPVVALTANALAEDRERCRESGMNDVLTKPLSRNAIERTIATFVPRVRESEAAAAS